MPGGRGDPNEGIYIPDRKDLILDLAGKNLNTGQEHKIKFYGSELDYISMKLDALDHINMFCMYAIAHDESRIDNEGEYRLDQEMIKLGDYTVCIMDNNEFAKRIESAIQKKNYQLAKRKITYFDIGIGMPPHPIGLQTLFYKDDKYKYQKEYRFAFDSKTEGTNPIDLNIGNISDITMLIKTSEVKYKIRNR